MATISAEEGALRRGADAVHDALVAIGERRKAVLGDVEQASYWQGSAAENFKAMMRTWDEKARGMLTTLDGLELALRGTESDQAVQEDEVSGSISKLASGMSGL